MVRFASPVVVGHNEIKAGANVRGREEEHRALAEMILEQIANEKRWDTLLDDPKRASAIDALADAALTEFNSREIVPT